MRLGFETISAAHPGAWYSLRYLTYKSRTVIDIGPVRGLATALDGSRVGRLKVPLNLGDLVTVVARAV